MRRVIPNRVADLICNCRGNIAGRVSYITGDVADCVSGVSGINVTQIAVDLIVVSASYIKALRLSVTFIYTKLFTPYFTGIGEKS